MHEDRHAIPAMDTRVEDRSTICRLKKVWKKEKRETGKLEKIQKETVREVTTGNMR